MPKSKVAITLNEATLHRLDELVDKSTFASRSRAVKEAVEEKLARLKRTHLARECAKLDRSSERALAEEGFSKRAPAAAKPARVRH